MPAVVLALVVAVLSAPGVEVPPPTVAPVPGAPARTFDPPDEPWLPGHRGVDLDADAHAAVRAARDGTVTFAGPVAGVGWLTIAHDHGLETTYGGVDPLVAVGDLVTLGQVIATMQPDRRHLDWGARRGGGYVDPLGLLGIGRIVLVPADPA